MLVAWRGTKRGMLSRKTVLLSINYPAHSPTLLPRPRSGKRCGLYVVPTPQDGRSPPLLQCPGCRGQRATKWLPCQWWALAKKKKMLICGRRTVKPTY
ncbi:hypothetical protein J6590_063672 [Homalodisca vitripennis]|nr:hypothetical protein J6590_063672 [Homalodisca vitripennis]